MPTCGMSSIVLARRCASTRARFQTRSISLNTTLPTKRNTVRICTSKIHVAGKSFVLICSDLNAKSPLRICFTPVHGVGQKFTPRFLHEIGFKTENIFDTPEQREPDADFATCPFPNPEEGRPVLVSEIHNAQYSLYEVHS